MCYSSSMHNGSKPSPEFDKEGLARLYRAVQKPNGEELNREVLEIHKLLDATITARERGRNPLESLQEHQIPVRDETLRRLERLTNYDNHEYGKPTDRDE